MDIVIPEGKEYQAGYRTFIGVGLGSLSQVASTRFRSVLFSNYKHKVIIKLEIIFHDQLHWRSQS